MSIKWTLLSLILLLGSGATLPAEPLDSSDVAYIDGQPCNRACQSYMDWSYRALSARRHEEREIGLAVPAEVDFERVEPMARPRVARHAAPVSRTAPHAGKPAANGKAANTKASNGRKIADPNSAPKAMPPAAVAVTPERPAEATVAAIQKREKAESAKPQEPMQAAAFAAPPTPVTASSKTSEIGKTASASPDDQDNLVALVLARPEITSLSDLNNKDIAITEKQSASSGRVSAALMAAGAAEVQFSEVKGSAIDRLMAGEVPAAVVLAPREVASLFPKVAGFRTFRVPLEARL